MAAWNGVEGWNGSGSLDEAAAKVAELRYTIEALPEKKDWKNTNGKF